MNKFKKILTTGVVVAALGSTVLASTPAAAWYNGYGWGWGPGAVAAGVIGGLALGAVAAGAAAGAYPGYGYGYGYPAYYPAAPAAPVRTCRARQPVYDAWGNFAGYQRVYVPC